MKGKDKGRV